jgi:hypothetical protein
VAVAVAVTTAAQKSKSKSLLSTPWWHIGGLEVQLHTFLTSALNGSEWLISRPRQLYPRERIGDLVGPRDGPDISENSSITTTAATTTTTNNNSNNNNNNYVFTCM